MRGGGWMCWVALIGCQADPPGVDPGEDAAVIDATPADARPFDAVLDLNVDAALVNDAALIDAIPIDAAPIDAAPIDATPIDALLDAAPDRAMVDAALPMGPGCVATFADAVTVTLWFAPEHIDYVIEGADAATLHWRTADDVEGWLGMLPQARGRLVSDIAHDYRVFAEAGLMRAGRDPDRRATVRCPRPDRPDLQPWVGWRYAADFDGDGVDEQYAWDAAFHAPYVPTIDDALVVEWSPDASANRDNIVAALRSGSRKILLAAPPDPAMPWQVDNQIPIIKAFNINAPDGLEFLLAEGITLEAAPAPYFHDNTAKLLSIDEMDGMRLAAVDMDGDGRIAPTRVRMRRDLYDPASPSYDPAHPPSESRHALRVFRTRDLLVQDLTFADSGGDGIYLGSTWINHPEEPQIHVLNQRVTLRRVVAANNFRQGMTVVGVWGLRVERSTFRDTRGTPPSYGIDFEPNNAHGATRDVVIRDSQFIDNARAGIGFAFGHFTSDAPVEVAVLDSTITGAAGGSDGVKIHNFDDGRVANIYLRGVRIEQLDYYGIFFSGKNAETARVTLEDCWLRDTARRLTWPRRNDAGEIVQQPTAPIAFTRAYVERFVGGVRFIDTLVDDPLERPTVHALARADRQKAVKDLEGRLFVRSLAGAAVFLPGPGNVNVDFEVVRVPR